MKTLPAQFVEMLSSLPGHDDVALAMADSESPVALRFNPAKLDISVCVGTLRKVPWEPAGVYLTHRPAFTFMPGLYDGHFYVQDPSAMITGEVIRRISALEKRPLTLLDACAAPGGKATSALAALPPGSFVLANEFDADRMHALADNLQRWGVDSYAVSRMDARQLSDTGPVFDIVNADVPCSGEGMMRKNDIAVSQWSPALVDRCAALQREIVASVWHTLKPGGWLVYSTCTFNTAENEENTAWIRDTLGAEPVDLALADFPGVTASLRDNLPAARFLPGKVDGEGQFVAVFRKPGEPDEFRVPRGIKPTVLPPWLNDGYDGFATRSGDVFAVARQHLPLLSHLMSRINIVTPGLHVAATKGRDLIPAHALATSTALRGDAFPTVKVPYADAMAYLRGEALRLPSDTPRGIVLVSHDTCRLGWANNLGTRANNLLPKGVRIRSALHPATPPTFT